MANRYRSNPDIPLLGVDFFDALEIGAGAAGVAVLNDKMVTPFAKGVLPALYGNETVAKIADFASTVAVGFLASKGVSMFNRHAAKQVATGAAILAVPKLVSIIVPGFFLNAGLPTSFQFVNPLAPRPEPKAVAAANGAQALAVIGVGTSMGI